MQIYNFLPLFNQANCQNALAKKNGIQLKKLDRDTVSFCGKKKTEEVQSGDSKKADAHYNLEWIDKTDVRNLVSSIVKSNTKPQISLKDAKKILNYFGYVQVPGQSGDHIYFEPQAYRGKGIIFTLMSQSGSIDLGAVADLKKAIMDLDQNNGELMPELNANASEERFKKFREQTAVYNPEGGNKYRAHLEEYRKAQAEKEAQEESERQAEELRAQKEQEKQEAVRTSEQKAQEAQKDAEEANSIMDEIEGIPDQLFESYMAEMSTILEVIDKTAKLNEIKTFFAKCEEQGFVTTLPVKERDRYIKWLQPKGNKGRTTFDKLCQKFEKYCDRFGAITQSKEDILKEKIRNEQSIRTNPQTRKADIERRKALKEEIEGISGESLDNIRKKYNQIVTDKDYKEFNEMFDFFNKLYEEYEPFYTGTAPIKETPKTKEAPIEEAPVEEAPNEEKPIEDEPVGENTTEEAPVEETPVEEAPIEEKPVEEEPIEEAPIEEEPVEEAPVVAVAPVEEPTETAADTPISIDKVIASNQSIAKMFEHLRIGIGYTSISEANDDLFRIFKESFATEKDIEKLSKSSIEEYKKFINEEKLPEVKRTNEWVQTTRAIIFSYLEYMSEFASDTSDWFNLDSKTILALIKAIKEGKGQIEVEGQPIFLKGINSENIKENYKKNKGNLKNKEKEEIVNYISTLKKVNKNTKENISELLDKEFSYMANIIDPKVNNNYKIKLLNTLSQDYKKQFNSDDLEGLSDILKIRADLDAKRAMIGKIDYSNIFNN